MEVLEKVSNPTLTIHQLEWVDQQIARQVRDKAELEYGETTHFSIDPIKLKNGLKVEADISIHYREEEPYDCDFISEENRCEISTIDACVYMKSIDALIVDGEDGYPIDLQTNHTEVEISELLS
jgi:hypothetical protein